MSSMLRVKVVQILNPFDPSQRLIREVDWIKGKTLSEYLRGVDESREFVASVNGGIVESDDLSSTVVEFGDCIVICPIPESGGGGGGKNILRMIAMVALAYAVGPLAEMAVGAEAASLGLVKAGIMMVGSAIVSAILPVTPLESPKDDAYSGPSYGIDGAKNTSSEGMPTPVCYGRFRMGSNRIGTYAENIENTQHLYMLLNAGEGPIGGISDILINNQPISNYQDIETQIRLGAAEQSVVDWFGDTVTPQSKGITLNESWTTHITSTEIDKFRIDLSFPIGLFSTGGKDATAPARVDFECQYREAGSTGWQILRSRAEIESKTAVYEYSPVYETSYGIGSDVPEMQQTAPAQTLETLIQGTHVGKGFGEESPGMIYNDEGRVVGHVAYKTVYSEELYVSDKSRSPVRTSFKSPLLQQSVYEIRIKRTTKESDNEKVADKVVLTDLNEITTADVSYANTALVAMKVRLSDQLNSLPNITFVSGGVVIKEWDDDLSDWIYAPSNNPAWVTYDILTNKRYGAGINPARLNVEKWKEWARHCKENDFTFNGVFEANGNIWDSLQYVLSSGHAQIVKAGTRYTVAIEKPDIPVMMFSSTNIKEGTFERVWMPRSDRANEIEVEFNNQENDYKKDSIKMYDEELLDLPQKTSRITLYGITTRERAQREAIFYLNMNRFIHDTVSFEASVDAIACTIGDLIVVQEDLPNWINSGHLKGGTKHEVQLDSTVTIGDGQYALLVYQPKAWVKAGTIVNIVDDILYVGGLTKEAASRVSRVVISGVEYQVDGIASSSNSSAVGIVVPSAKGIASVGNGASMWQTNVITEAPVYSGMGAGEHDVIKLSSPLPGDDIDGVYWTFGEMSKVKKTYRVTSIGGDHGYDRKITAVAYDAEVYNTDGVLIGSSYPVGDAMQHVADLAVYEDVITINDVKRPRVNLSWTPVNYMLYRGADVWVSKNGDKMSRVSSADITSRRYELEAEVGDVYEFKVVAFDKDGTRMPISTAPTISHIVTGPMKIPEPPVSLTLTPGNFEIRLDWVINEGLINYDYMIIYGEQIRGDGSPAGMQEIGRTTDNYFLHTGLPISTTVCYWIRVVDKNAKESLIFPGDKSNNAIIGVCGSTLSDIASMIEDLDLEIGESQLSGDLSSRIDKIDTQGALWDRVDHLEGQVGSVAQSILSNAMSLDYSAAVIQEDVTIVSNELAQEITNREVQAVTMMSDMGEAITAAIVDERVTRVNAEEALAGTISIVDARVGDAEALIVSETAARVTGDEALAGTISIVDARVGDAEALIVSETAARVTGDEANASSIQTLGARVGSAEAAISTESSARVNGDSINASQISTLGGRVGDVEAAVQTEANARVSGDSVNASLISTVQTTVGSNYAITQQHASSIDGITGEYTVKIDANGKVRGFGLINGPETSEFLVHADRFAVGLPGDYPFIIDGGKVYMKDAYIKDAAVDTLKIKGQAVTLPVSAFTAGSITLSSSYAWYTVQTVSITSTGAPIFIAGFAQATGSYSDIGDDVLRSWPVTVQLRRNGIALMTSVIGSSDTGNNVIVRADGPAVLMLTETPGVGTHTYTMHARVAVDNGNGAGSVASRSLMCLEMKR